MTFELGARGGSVSVWGVPLAPFSTLIWDIPTS